MLLFKTYNHNLTPNFSENLSKTKTQNQNTRNIKKVVLFVCLLFFTVLLTGCANITYSRVLHPGGMVEDKVIITLETEKLSTANISVNQLKSDINKDLQTYYFANIRLYTAHLEHLATPETLLEKEQIVFGIEPTVNEKEIVATIQFKTRSAFNNYNTWLKLMQEQQNPNENPNETNEDESPNITTSQSFFYTVHTQTTNTVFTEDLFTTLSPVLKYNAKYGGNGLGFSDLSFSQIYGNTDTHLRSNADYVAIINNIKLHQWNINNPLSSNHQMEFYTYIPNTSNWYITALGISLAVAIVVLFAGLLQNKTKIIIAKKQ